MTPTTLRLPRSRSRPQVYLHLISDATGTAVERMARAAMAQFYKSFTCIFVSHPFVKQVATLAKILDEAQAQEGMVLYTINDRHLRKWLDEQRRQRDLPMIDMLGQLFDQAEKRYHAQPLLDSALLRRALGEASLRLAEAVDFTLRHDDGAGLSTMGLSDVILVGVSRTSKTPTSIYLSCNYSLKVANVPLMLGIDPPDKLFSLRRPRLVGLTIDPDKLAHIRRSRYGRKALEGYNDPGTIFSELAYSEDVFERLTGIQVINVTNRPIEEVANMIVSEL